MPTISYGPAGVGQQLGDALMFIAQQKREKDHLDLLTKRVEHEMGLQDQEESRRSALFGEHQEDRARDAKARGDLSQGYGEMLGGGEPQAQPSQPIGADDDLSMSPKARRNQAQEQDTSVKLRARAKIIGALTNMGEHDAARRTYEAGEKEMREHGATLARANIQEDTQHALAGGGFDVPLAGGQVDQSASQQAQMLLAASQDPDADPLDIAKQLNELHSKTSERKLHEAKIGARLQKATAEMQVRSQLEDWGTLDKRQAMLNALQDGSMELKEFDQLWPDAGAKQQMNALAMENAKLKNALLRTQDWATGPEGMGLEAKLGAIRDGAKPRAIPAAPSQTDPALSASRRIRNLRDATSVAKNELGELDAKGKATDPAMIRERASQILQESEKASVNGNPRQVQGATWQVDALQDQLRRGLGGSASNGSISTNGPQATKQTTMPPRATGSASQPAQQEPNLPGSGGPSRSPEDALRSEIKAGKLKTPEAVRARAKALGAKLK